MTSAGCLTCRSCLCVDARYVCTAGNHFYTIFTLLTELH